MKYKLRYLFFLLGICVSVFTSEAADRTLAELSDEEACTVLADTTYLTATHCDGTAGCLFNNTAYPPGISTIILTGSGGMDSVIILECLVLPTDMTTLDVQLCDGETYIIDGQTLFAPFNGTFVFTNQFGCDSVVVLNLLASPEIVISIDNIIGDICSSCTGSIDINISGGVPPYQFIWSNGSSDEDVTGLCAGNYEVQVFDSFGCLSSLSINVPIDTTAAGLAVFEIVLGPMCIGACEHSITLETECGVPPYTYDWSDDNYDGQQNPVNMCAGTYTVTVTDAQGQNATLEITHSDSPAMSGSLLPTNVSCNGGADGSIEVVMTGGEPPFFYNWNSGGSSSNTLSGLPIGVYRVTVADINGCTIELDTFLLQPPELRLIFERIDVSCNADGSLFAVPTGGTGDYAYTWSNGELTQSLTGLTSGTYTVTVEDANGCAIIDSAYIAPPFQLTTSSTFANCDSTGGSATVMVDGSINPIYAWSNGASESSITDVAPGWYSVTVTNANNNCQTHTNILVPLDTACFVRISGHVFLDDDNRDCVVDPTTSEQPNILMELDNGERTFTNQSGYYEFRLLPGIYNVEMRLNSSALEPLCGTALTVNAPDFGGQYSDNNFYLRRSDIRDLRVWVSKGNARPGFIHQIDIQVQNNGAIPMDGTLTFVHDPVQEFLSTSIPATNYDATIQTLSWDFADLPPGLTKSYKVRFQIPVGTPLGQPLSMYFKVDPIIGDIMSDDNELTCNMVVTGSYDPNDKQVQPEGIGDEGAITMEDSLLTYRIRFQNTGTDTAFTVVIRDTLDNNLDPSTVVPGPASHPYELTFLKGNILEFTFDNILLPDSFVNEPASNGFVFFDVQLKEGLDYGDSMKNTAAIYFDFNEPIITNTVINTLRRPVGVLSPETLDIALTASPNPTKDEVVIAFELGESLGLSMHLYDSRGHQVEEIHGFQNYEIGTYRRAIDLREYPTGVYLLAIRSADGKTAITRLLKL